MTSAIESEDVIHNFPCAEPLCPGELKSQNNSIHIGKMIFVKERKYF
jgi:hypothetical protein